MNGLLKAIANQSKGGQVLITKLRRNMKNRLLKLNDRLLLRKRSMIE
ncbi:MAG: hypothetical protein K6T90_15920, partial [Leptolyngbyaceae cyanobacterium HOT.MB2.61]|nr:hypothetical protein [Leptolyngbyaceae cyanobacterium HOT.MB2.61]